LLPTLIIAGAPKSGTSSLFRWLSDHPEVLGSTVKETCYFCDPGSHVFNRANNYLRSGLEGYARFFVPNGTIPRLVVEATPSYMYSALALRELPRLPSKPHFVFMLREPVAQIRSLFRYFQSNWTWIPARTSFAQFIAEVRSGRARFGGNELAENAIANAEYAPLLSRWREAVGDGRIHVFLFEEAFTDQRAFMRRVAEKFGIDPGFYLGYDFPAENQTYSVRSKMIQKLNVAVRSLIPRGVIYETTRSIYRSLNTRRDRPDTPLDAVIEASLRDQFFESNGRLEREFDLNLHCWKEPSSSPVGSNQKKGALQHVAG
jgi:hypothetical protein